MTTRVFARAPLAFCLLLGFVLGGVVRVADAQSAATSDEGARAASDAGASPDGAAAIAVRALFERRCGDCHGPQLVKPKGKFGYLLDLARVAANDEYVVAGKPRESEIFLTCESGEMPPEDERDKYPQLDAAELAVISNWIALGAPPVPAPTTQESASDAPADGTPNGSKEAPPTPTELAGRTHPLVVHFPIALLLAALLAELLFLVSRSSALGGAAGFCTVLGFLGAAASSATGWIFADEEGYGASHAVLFVHRWGGIAVAVLALIAVLLLARTGRTEGSRWPFRFVLLVTAAAVALVGHYGGVLVYGEEHLPLPIELPFEGWAKSFLEKPKS